MLQDANFNHRHSGEQNHILTSSFYQHPTRGENEATLFSAFLLGNAALQQQ